MDNLKRKDYTVVKCGRGYEVLLNGEFFLYFRTKRLAKKFVKDV